MNTKAYRMQFQEQAEAMLREMTLDEKIHMMSGHCKLTDSMGGGSYNTTPYPFGGCERLGLPDLNFCDGPRGVVSGNSTCFPVAMARGATFDRELEYQVGTVIGREIRANGGSYFGGVCTNVPYNPGAGRSQESFGEDSYHMGEMALAVMQGVQDQGVIACSKHFAFNSMENARFKVDMDMDARTEHEVYLPHFKKLVDHGVGSVMNAYNLFRGEKCGHSHYLLKELLKGDWGFDGFVISDFIWGVKDAGKGIHGGCDVEMHAMNHYAPQKVKKALSDGKITEADIDDACLRLIRTTLAFEAQRRELPGVGPEILACEEHRGLARRVAEESITLLKNKDAFLPLNPGKKLVLVGDLCDIENIGDHGSSKVRPPYVKTLVQGIREQYPACKFEFVATREVNKKKDIISTADAVVMMCGMRHSDEGEFIFVTGGDRKSLELHRKERNMIASVSAMNLNCAVILTGGNVVMTHSWQDKVKAILFAYYPGMEGGNALADILFGKVNPSGRLPFAIAAEEASYPRMKWNAKAMRYEYYHGYRLLDKKNAACDYPFGHGLSYTSFEMTPMALVQNTETTAVFETTVTNTGAVRGGCVPQIYVSFPKAAVDRPVRTLAAFTKVFLDPNESKSVTLTVNKDELRWYDEKTRSFVADSGYGASLANNSREMLFEEIPF